MDFATFKAQLDAARRAEHTIDGVAFHVRLPTDYAVRVAFETYRDAFGRSEHAKAFCEVLTQSIVGWSGATARHFLPDSAPDPIEFSGEALVALLEARRDMFDQLAFFISDKLHLRRERLEASAKN